MAAVLFVLAVIGALPVPIMAAWVLTPLLTGWRRQPGIVQGCEASVHCAESNAFFVTWVASILLYAVACGWAHRLLFRRAAAKWRRAHERTWPWQAEHPGP